MTDEAGGDRDAEAEIRVAITEVRRESLKAAMLTATLDATVVVLAVNLVLSVFSIPGLGSPVAGPVPARVLVAAGAGLLVGGVEVAVRARRPAVERFEDANPAVSEALRTARDAVESDRGGRVVRALYDDVIDRLSETSSRDLVPWRRVGVTALVLVAVAGGTVAVSAAGLTVDLGGDDGRPTPTTADRSGTPTPGVAENDTELRSGDEVLGEPTEVSAGDQNVSAPVQAQRGGQGNRDPEEYDRSGYADDGSGTDAQRAGYADTESVEEADLIREFTLALNEEE